jgi:RNA polymerase sigma factor (sigma-70 family)
MNGHGKNGGGWLVGAAVRCQPDSRLVGLAREGHSVAFDEIVRRYRAPLVAFAAAIVADHQAEDVVQDALTRAHDAITTGAAEINLRPWLYTIVRNRALNAVRDETAHEHLDENFDGVPQPAEVATQREELASLTQRLKDLPAPQREALVKRELEGRGHREIAASMGVTTGAVRGLIFRARTALRDGAGLLIPMPVLRSLLSEGSVASEATGTAGATAAAGLAAGGGGGIAVKAGATLGVAVIAVGGGFAIQHRGDKSDQRAEASARESQAGSQSRGGSRSGARLAGVGTLARSNEGPGSTSSGPGGREGPSESSGPGSGSGSGSSGGSGDGDHEDGDDDSSGSGSSGSGSDGGDSDESDSSRSGSSGSSGSGSSGSGSGLSGSSGSGSSGSGSDGDDSIESDSSGSGSSGESG